MKNSPKVIIRFLGFVFLLGIGLFLILIGSIYRNARIDGAQEADAIVVLGASQWNGVPSPVLQARLDHAYDLYQFGLAPLIILTGGIGDGEGVSESEVGKSYLMGLGVSSDSIAIEDRGRTSLQSMRGVSGILDSKRLKSVVIVSDGFHLYRLKTMARDLGLEAVTSPVKDSRIAENLKTELRYVIREAGVYLLYILFNV